MRTLKQIAKQVAEEKNLPPEMIESALSFYWEEGVKKNLSQANYRSIFLTGLGTITISRYKLREYIIKIIGKIRAMETFKWCGEVRRKIIIDTLKGQLAQLCKRRNEIAHAYRDAYGTKVRMRKLTLKDYYKNQS